MPSLKDINLPEDFIQELEKIGFDLEKDISERQDKHWAWGATPLMHAITLKHIPAIECLIHNKVDVNVVVNSKRATLWAIEESSDTILLMLIKAGAYLNTENHHEYLMSPLERAAIRNEAKCAQILLEHQAEVNLISTYESTPLHYAATYGSHEVCELLVQHKVEINYRKEFDGSALDVACKNGHLRIVQLLLDNGANYNYAGENRQNVALKNAFENEKETNVGIINLLLNKGANPSYQYDLLDYTFIGLAIKKNINVIDSLVAHGSDIHFRTIYEEGYLEHAIREKASTKIITTLIDLGANLKYYNLYKMGILHKAIKQKTPSSIIQILIDRGADVNFVNTYKTTLLDEALGEYSPIDTCEVIAENLNEQAVQIALKNFFTSHSLQKTNLSIAKILIDKHFLIPCKDFVKLFITILDKNTHNPDILPFLQLFTTLKPPASEKLSFKALNFHILQYYADRPDFAEIATLIFPCMESSDLTHFLIESFSHKNIVLINALLNIGATVHDELQMQQFLKKLANKHDNYTPNIEVMQLLISLLDEQSLLTLYMNACKEYHFELIEILDQNTISLKGNAAPPNLLLDIINSHSKYNSYVTVEKFKEMIMSLLTHGMPLYALDHNINITIKGVNITAELKQMIEGERLKRVAMATLSIADMTPIKIQDCYAAALAEEKVFVALNIIEAPESKGEDEDNLVHIDILAVQEIFQENRQAANKLLSCDDYKNMFLQESTKYIKALELTEEYMSEKYQRRDSLFLSNPFPITMGYLLESSPCSQDHAPSLQQLRVIKSRMPRKL